MSDSIRNVYACLVHESRDCVIDLVSNLRALDADSLILVYNGGCDRGLLGGDFPFDRYGAVVHPAPRPIEWGYLHPFALDCMRWARDHCAFDTLTIVDSDQLALRPGYCAFLSHHLSAMPDVGLLGNSTCVQGPGTRVWPASLALPEVELWRPLLRQFPDGERKFVHWCFWPSTVFTADAARDLVKLFDENQMLQDIMRRTRIWATEEVILPTLVALLGYKIGPNPCSYDLVQYRVSYAPSQLEAALDRKEAFWIHPVPRRYEDPLRRRIREKWRNYEPGAATSSVCSSKETRGESAAPLLLTIPILERMRRIEGWLEDAEADLLIAAVARAAAAFPEAALVEVGSFCGKATVVLGSALRASGAASRARVYAIDPHDGVVGAFDRGIRNMGPTLERFLRNIAGAGLNEVVEPVVKRAPEVQWNRPISLLLIDGLHDYASVAADFNHFEAWLAPGGLVAFHDYADYFPAVKIFVRELLACRGYRKVHHAGSMVLLRKTGEAQAPADPGVGEQARESPSPALDPVTPVPGRPAARLEPMVSCIMPTADRRAFVPQSIRYFLRQDYANRELIILDDGADNVEDLIPADSRIRYLRLDSKRSMGAKHNLACELARGEIIVHWDDDDWMAEWRLSYQVENLRSMPANTLSGLSRLLFYDPIGAGAWEYIYTDAARPWVCGNTFCYYREFSERHRFPDMNEGADTRFVWGLQGATILPLQKSDFLIGLVHPSNTSRKRTRDPAWHAIPLATIYGLLNGDRPYYHELATKLAGGGS